MCGICGWAGKAPAKNLTPMVNALRHRGPDEQGLWSDADAALGIARLAIIDVRHGQQPAFSTNKSVVSVFNGEIYNFRSLAERVDYPVSGSPPGDSALVPLLYERYGLDFVHLLRGMFAIAIGDIRSRQLILVRDRVGKKPLLYAEAPGGIAFASEARALLAGGMDARPNLSSIDHVLAFDHVPINESAYEGIKSLPPGSVLTWSEGSSRIERYWEWRPETRKISVGAALREVEGKLEDAVRARLVSERPVGSFLSGGIDSTIVTALMGRFSHEPVRTFSIGFTDPEYDESGFARAVANHLGTTHTDLIVEPDPRDLVLRVSRVFDQPFADSSALPTLLLSELAAQDVVVALAGDGGDEAFGGYVRYWAAPMLQNWQPVLRVASRFESVARYARSQRSSTSGDRLSRSLQTYSSLGNRYMALMLWMTSQARHDLWTEEAAQFLIGVTPEQRFGELWLQYGGASDLDRMRAHDLNMYLPGDLLAKVDTTSMACSLEVRSPFLDQEVLSFAAMLPKRAMIRGRTNKWILRQLAYKMVPRELVDRPKKGFGIPRAQWLRGPLRELTHDVLLGDNLRHRGWFNSGFIASQLQEHDAGIDRDDLLWPILMTELWAREWLDQ